MNPQLLIFFSDLFRHPRRIMMSSRVPVRNELRLSSTVSGHTTVVACTPRGEKIARKKRGKARRFIVGGILCQLQVLRSFRSPPSLPRSFLQRAPGTIRVFYKDIGKEVRKTYRAFFLRRRRALDRTCYSRASQPRGEEERRREGMRTASRIEAPRGSTSSRHWNSETRNTVGNRRYRSNRKSDKWISTGVGVSIAEILVHPLSRVEGILDGIRGYISCDPW